MHEKLAEALDHISDDKLAQAAVARKRRKRVFSGHWRRCWRW